MTKSHHVTSIVTKHGEHIWTFQGAKQSNPKYFAHSQAVQCGDLVSAKRILESGVLVKIY